MQLKYEKVECFKAYGIFFTKVSEWNGFEEWKDPQGRKLIVARAGGFVDAFHDVFSGILGGEGSREVLVIQADKGLLADIEAAQAKEVAQ